MYKIYLYECKRLLLNKFFFGILLVILFYGWQVLSNITIFGVCRTAPFSAWSFGDYISRMLPVLWIGSLFFLTFFMSAKAKRVSVLIDATPINPQRYAIARCAAALTGTCLLVFACLAEAAVFYGSYFKQYDPGDMLLPALITLVPMLVFALGSGWFFGKKTWLIYFWMVVPLVLRVLPQPNALGFLDGSFFIQYPLTTGELDPVFRIPASAVWVQSLLFVVGVILLIYAPDRKDNLNKNAFRL